VLDSVCRESVLHRGDELPLQRDELTALVKHIVHRTPGSAARSVLDVRDE